jgi:hypothetical protein
MSDLVVYNLATFFPETPIANAAVEGEHEPQAA